MIEKMIIFEKSIESYNQHPREYIFEIDSTSIFFDCIIVGHSYKYNKFHKVEG